MSKNYAKLNERLKRARVNSNLSAAIAGVTPGVIRQMFCGYRAMPSVVEKKLTKFLNSLQRSKTNGKVK